MDLLVDGLVLMVSLDVWVAFAGSVDLVHRLMGMVELLIVSLFSY